MSHIPQWIYIALMIASLGVACHEHGKPRNPGNVFYRLADYSIELIILIAGGFFSGMFN